MNCLKSSDYSLEYYWQMTKITGHLSDFGEQIFHKQNNKAYLLLCGHVVFGHKLIPPLAKLEILHCFENIVIFGVQPYFDPTR